MNGSEEKNRIPVEMNRGDPAESQLGLLRGKGMYLEHLRRVLGHLKRALRKEQPLTVEEFNQLLQLSEAIIDYGRMIQEHFRYWLLRNLTSKFLDGAKKELACDPGTEYEYSFRESTNPGERCRRT